MANLRTNVTYYPLLACILVLTAGTIYFATVLSYRRSRWPVRLEQRTNGAEVEVGLYLNNFDLENRSVQWHLGVIRPAAKAKTNFGAPLGTAELANGDSMCVTDFSIASSGGEQRPEDVLAFTTSRSSLSDNSGVSLSYLSQDPNSYNRPFCRGKLADYHEYQKFVVDDTIKFFHFEYFYPFDEIRINVAPEVRGYYMSDRVKSGIAQVPSDFDWSFDFPGWELGHIGSQSNGWVFLTLKRSLMIRVTAVFLLTTALLFILLLSSISDLGVLAQVATGIFFGLWGIRQILQPPNVETTTVLDPIFGFLYISLVVVILFRLVFFRLSVSGRNESPVSRHIAPLGQTQETQHNLQYDRYQNMLLVWGFAIVLMALSGIRRRNR